MKLRQVTYSGVTEKKPVRITVYIEKGVRVPANITHPTLGVSLRKVGKEMEFAGTPPKGSFLLRAFSKEKIAELAEKDAKQIMQDLEDNPDNYPNPEDLKKKSEKHWISQYTKIYEKQGELTEI